MTEIGFQTRLPLSCEAALERVTEALKVEGFGVLTSINIQETMKNKLNVDFRNYTILGACNPTLAHKALSARLDVGLLLPCNVTVFEEEGQSVISIVDPQAMFSILASPDLQPIIAEARERLMRVSESLRVLSQPEQA